MTLFRFVSFRVPCDVEVRHGCGPGTCLFPELAAHVERRLPPGAECRAPEQAPVATVTMTCVGDRIEMTGTDREPRTFHDESIALHEVDGAVRAIVAVEAPGLIFIHAGSVALNGRALILPGRSFAGKTTLVAALIQAGAEYLSDEYALIDERGRVHGYPRRLSLRSDTGRREVSATDLGAVTAQSPKPVSVVAALRFEPDATWTVTGQSEAACAEALLSNAVAAQIRPAEVLGAVATVARATRFFTGVRGDVDDAVPRLMKLLAGNAR